MLEKVLNTPVESFNLFHATGLFLYSLKTSET